MNHPGAYVIVNDASAVLEDAVYDKANTSRCQFLKGHLNAGIKSLGDAIPLEKFSSPQKFYK